MFDNIQLFTKTDNKVQEPNKSWTKHTCIHCSFELNLGFGSANIVWGTGNSIKLRYLIDFFVNLNKFITDSQRNELVFSLKHNESTYNMIWSKEQGTSVKIIRNYYNSNSFILQKSVWSMDIIDFKTQFFTTVMTKLSKDTNNEVTTAIGEAFEYYKTDINFEFKIGQQVETVIGQNIKTKRQGIVARRSYHDKDKTTLYYLLVDGKILTKRYLPNDLKRQE